ncbi:hypothetical protein RB623_22540 [Mesorhizobium sp. LHD-90]|nr:hypothetical protein [Mesorhizobium sp. LHD-90]MDQ6436838.1 hypothetical protein [Mesorhizobium sp. LHD-90]
MKDELANANVNSKDWLFGAGDVSRKSIGPVVTNTELVTAEAERALTGG